MPLAPGKLSSLILFLIVVIALLYQMNRAKGGKLPKLRRIAGLDAMEEGIGRATELGRPVFFTPGRAEINTAGAAQTFAALEILSYVGELTAKYNVELRTAIAAANVLPLAEEIVKQSYLKMGHPDKYKPEFVQFLSTDQFAYAAGSLNIMNREKVATAVMMGEFQAESMLLAEGAAQVGAISIAGTSRTFQIPFFIAACDYTLIGEELFAGGAYLSKNPDKLGTVAGQDIGKVLASLLILAGSLLATANVKVLVDLLKK